MTILEWYELRPYPAAGVGEHPDDLAVVMDHVPEFVLVASKDDRKVRVHIRVRPAHLPLLEGLPRMEPVRTGPPRLEGYPLCHRYVTVRHCALPISPRDASRPSIYRLLGDSAEGAAYLMVSARRAASHPRISGYIRSLERGRPPDGVAGMVSGILGGPSGRPGPAQARNLQMAREKAASRHLFRCEVVATADHPAGLAAVEAAFPSMSLRRAARMTGRRLAAVSARGPGQPWFGGSRDPILSDMELGSFMGLPDEVDMAAVPLEPGRMGAHSGGERVEAPGATAIDIERPDGQTRSPSKAPGQDAAADHDG